MTRRHSLLLFAAIISLSLTEMAPNNVGALAQALPDKLTDGEYFGLSSLSSRNPMASSNPTTCCRTSSRFSISSPSSCGRRKPNRVYLGVGPEQNFTYISAVNPRMVFIVDIGAATWSFI